MTFPLAIFLAIGIAYFIGALPIGYWAGRWKGIDIREHGSKNIGATNVLRVLGKGVGIPVFVLDCLKGVVPVLLGRGLVGGEVSEASTSPEFWRATTDVATALAAILGHNYTFWLGFKGGKGVATSAGAVATILPWPFLAGAVVWGATFFSTRYVALASIFAGFAIPVAVLAEWAVRGEILWPHLVFAVLASVFCVLRHRPNIERLKAGTEHKFVPKSQIKKEVK